MAESLPMIFFIDNSLWKDFSANVVSFSDISSNKIKNEKIKNDFFWQVYPVGL